jgi:hypothetical protein
VEHGIGHLTNWRALSGHLGRREQLDTILPAMAGLVSAQERALRPDRRPRSRGSHQIRNPHVAHYRALMLSLQDELRRVLVRRNPPVRVLVTRPAHGREWSGLLHGWAHDVADDRGLRALVTYRREHPPDDWADVVAWVLPEHVRRV